MKGSVFPDGDVESAIPKRTSVPRRKANLLELSRVERRLIKQVTKIQWMRRGLYKQRPAPKFDGTWLFIEARATPARSTKLGVKGSTTNIGNGDTQIKTAPTPSAPTSDKVWVTARGLTAGR